jgi:hypothetical protein
VPHVGLLRPCSLSQLHGFLVHRDLDLLPFVEVILYRHLEAQLRPGWCTVGEPVIAFEACFSGSVELDNFRTLTVSGGDLWLEAGRGVLQQVSKHSWF